MVTRKTRLIFNTKKKLENSGAKRKEIEKAETNETILINKIFNVIRDICEKKHYVKLYNVREIYKYLNI